MKTRLRYWRSRRALTVADLAEKAGLSVNPIVNMERRGSWGYPSTRRKLAAALDITVDELFTTDDDPQADGAQAPPQDVAA